MGCEKNYLTPGPPDHTSGSPKRMNGKSTVEAPAYAADSMAGIKKQHKLQDGRTSKK